MRSALLTRAKRSWHRNHRLLSILCNVEIAKQRDDLVIDEVNAMIGRQSFQEVGVDASWVLKFWQSCKGL